MKMIFTGQNGSLGFINGKKYDVSLSIRMGGNIQVVAIDEACPCELKYCEYSNRANLFANWKYTN